MSRDVNQNLCLNELCPDNRGRPPMADTRHHHVFVASTIEQVATFDETHGGMMQSCGVAECRRVLAQTVPLADDEKLTAVQDDLIKQAAEIAEWWLTTAKADAERTVPKAVEYGAVDFDFMGMFMVSLIKDKFVGADDAELMRVGRELAVTFYMIGKMGRAVGAFQQGILPSNDTVFDMRIYAMMWERIRQTGDWIK